MVDKLREIRDKISNDVKDMTFEQLMEYLKNKKALYPALDKRNTEMSA